ncbi:hypothetical protein RFI_29342 [Reticulomyxa filosa]|uniref:Uncharacterized protein n=1 Tax=Reticulomyxa filosa TaxID=46433 RepID=X6M3K1_RETFI|nr:hypothetical protein RFI_29342 [Reticulomyxa filosa]|eukprot:ETO08047.1 hypothetical protein RFI_29342 [Reticulomyxa filosa]
MLLCAWIRGNQKKKKNNQLVQSYIFFERKKIKSKQTKSQKKNKTTNKEKPQKKKLRFGIEELILERLGQIHIIFSRDVTKTNSKRAFASKRGWDHISVRNGIQFLEELVRVGCSKDFDFFDGNGFHESFDNFPTSLKHGGSVYYKHFICHFL